MVVPDAPQDVTSDLVPSVEYAVNGLEGRQGGFAFVAEEFDQHIPFVVAIEYHLQISGHGEVFPCCLKVVGGVCRRVDIVVL